MTTELSTLRSLLLATAGVGAAPASVSPNPKNLYKQWHEFQVGLGGRKAAKLFTAKERGGKVKHKYTVATRFGRWFLAWFAVE